MKAWRHNRNPPSEAPDGPARVITRPGRAHFYAELLYAVMLCAAAAGLGRLLTDHDPLLFAGVATAALSAYALRSYLRQM